MYNVCVLKKENVVYMYVLHLKLSNSLNDGNTIYQLQCQVIIKDPEKTQYIYMYMYMYIQMKLKQLNILWELVCVVYHMWYPSNWDSLQ